MAFFLQTLPTTTSTRLIAQYLAIFQDSAVEKTDEVFNEASMTQLSSPFLLSTKRQLWVTLLCVCTAAAY